MNDDKENKKPKKNKKPTTPLNLDDYDVFIVPIEDVFQSKEDVYTRNKAGAKRRFPTGGFNNEDPGEPDKNKKEKKGKNGKKPLKFRKGFLK